MKFKSALLTNSWPKPWDSNVGHLIGGKVRLVQEIWKIPTSQRQGLGCFPIDKFYWRNKGCFLIVDRNYSCFSSSSSDSKMAMTKNMLTFDPLKWPVLIVHFKSVSVEIEGPSGLRFLKAKLIVQVLEQSQWWKWGKSETNEGKLEL